MTSFHRAFVAGAAAVLAALVPQSGIAAGSYLAQVRTTSYGIHHVKAGDWGSLGFGYGYIYASDNICILAREVIRARGEQARFFGDSGGNVSNDFYYTWVNNDAYIQSWFDETSPEGQELLRGYADGYNRYLREVGVDGLPDDCRGQEWVRNLDSLDLLKVFSKLILRASSGALLELIVAAEPPGSRVAAPPPRTPQGLKAGLDLEAFAGLRKQELGSNMYAFGANATRNGRGMVLGNPHFDWEGPLRWYEIHLTIPGVLDVMGASLQGVPLVNIGFTENFAWSHTVSFADRFALYEVTLVPGAPTRYIVDGEQLEMEQETVSIEVLEGEELVTREHTFYRTMFGPVLDFAPLDLPVWPTGLAAFSVLDANAGNRRAIEQFLRMNLAQDLDEFVEVLQQQVGLPWVHTVAADRDGNAYFGDVSVVPNISDEKLVDCAPPFFGVAIIDLTGLVVLDGQRDACLPANDADAPQEGIVGPARLPQLHTQDYVTNSNDNHWLANPDHPLEGFPPTMGGEGTIRSLRTRLGLVQVQERLAGTDGMGAPGYTLTHLQETLHSARNYAAEMLVNDLGVLCVEEGPLVDLGDEVVDVSEACNVLANWDQRQGNEAVGPHIFLEFLEAMNNETGDDFLSDLFAVPFDAADPVNTPRDLAAGDAAEREQVMRWLAQGVQRVSAAGLALDAPWGSLQFSERNGVRIPIHGGRDGSGMFSIITADLVDGVGYAPIRHGNSYVQTITWDDEGNVVPEAILTYSQSSDPASAHYDDQTLLYSTGGWVRLPFTEAQIRADPDLVVRRLRERRRDPATSPRLP